MTLEMHQLEVKNVQSDFRKAAQDLGDFTTSVKCASSDGEADEAAIVAHKKVTIASFSLSHVDGQRSVTPMLRQVPVEARLTLTRRVSDCAVLAMDVELRLAARFSILLAGLPESSRLRVSLSHDGQPQDDATAMQKWVVDSSAAVRAAATWQMLHKWVKGEARGDGLEKQSASVVAANSKAASERLQNLFRELDVDRSGSLDYEEFRHLLERHGISMRRSAFASLMKHIDSNGDGVISHAEFAAHFQCAEIDPEPPASA